MIRRPPRSTRTDTLFPYTTLFRSQAHTTSLGAQPRIAGYETTRVNREASKQSALSLAGPWTGRSRCQLLMDGHPSLLRCAAYDGKPVGQQAFALRRTISARMAKLHHQIDPYRRSEEHTSELQSL